MPDPTRKENLHVLAARAEAGGDERLSDDCWRAMGWTLPDQLAWVTPTGRRVPGPRPDLRHSLDAQEALPGRIDQVFAIYAPETSDIKHWFASGRPECPAESRAPTEPLARLAAKLRAMAAQEDGGNAG